MFTGGQSTRLWVREWALEATSTISEPKGIECRVFGFDSKTQRGFGLRLECAKACGFVRRGPRSCEALAMLNRNYFLGFCGSFIILGAGCGSSGSSSGTPNGAAQGGTSASTGGASAAAGQVSVGGASSAGTGGATMVAPTTGGQANPGTGGQANPGTGGATNLPATGGSPNNTGTGGANTGGATAARSTGGSTSNLGTGGTTTNAGTGGKTGGGAVSTGGASTAATGGKTNGGTSSGAGGTSSSGGSSAEATGGAAAGADSTGCRVWLATTGVDTNAGTQAAPVLTIAKAYDLLCPPVTGSANGAECSGAAPRTLCIKSGTYAVATRFEVKKTRMGTASNPILIQGDPTSSTKPVIDFSTQPRVSCGADPSDGNLGGITINADYVTLKNLEVKGANDNGIKVQGAHGRVEQCVVHANADCGIQISDGSGYTGSGTNNTVINCDSYQNNDTQCNGANADGFCAKENSTDGGAGNVFDGCRSWDNADDGFDFYAWTFPVTVKNSWAFNMGGTTAGTGSNGNGFKMGGDKVSAAHVMSNCFAFDNNQTKGSSTADWGFTNNSNPATITCTGCGAWNNHGGSFQSITHTGDVTASATSAKAAAATRSTNGSLPAITSL